MITDDDIKEIIDLFISVANDTDALSEVMDEYKERSLALKIHDSAYKTGFMLQNGKIRSLRTLDRPTCLMTTDKDTFWKIINVEPNDVEKPEDKNLPEEQRIYQIQKRLDELRRLIIYTAFLTEKSLTLQTDDGDIQIHSENLIKIFTKITELGA